MLFVEATAVEAIGRITPGCLGLYSDENERALGRVVTAIRKYSPIALGIQLAHAGRKGSSEVPWRGGPVDPARPRRLAAGGPFGGAAQLAEEDPPEALDRAGHAADPRGLRRLPRAARSGSGSMRSSFTARTATCCTSSCRRSPTGARTITAGRARTGCAFRSRCSRPCARPGPSGKPLGVRISSTDWVEGGWDIEDSIALRGRAQTPRLRLDRLLERRRLAAAEDRARAGLSGAVRAAHPRRGRDRHDRRRPDYRYKAGRSDRRVGRCGHGRAGARACSTTRAGRGTPRRRSAARCTPPSSTGAAPPREAGRIFGDTKLGQR